jgi:hypothetical protein
MSRKYFSKACFAFLFVMCLISTANALVFSDGTFKNEDWRLDVMQLGTGGDGSSTATASQQLSGGNPGEYRQIINTLNSGGGVIGYHFYKNSVYNPSVQGEITSIDFSYDHKMFLGFGEGQSTSFAILQGGVYFMCAPGTWANQAAWETLSATGLTAESFGTLGDPAIHPDFSTSGGPILFGFHTANGGYNYSITVGIDNWSVKLNTIPIIAANIDIKPKKINLKNNKDTITVAILSTADFNAPNVVDQTSLTFGRTGDEKSLCSVTKPKDVNHDGILDMVCMFYTVLTGFEAGDLKGVLKGNTVNGSPILGSDSVRVID